MDGNFHQSQRCFESRLRHGNLAYLGTLPREVEHPPISRRVVFLLPEHFSVMAFTSAVDAIVTANLVARNSLYRFETYSLGDRTVHSDLGIGISVDGQLSELDAKGVDLLIVCGGYRAALEARRPVVEKLREVAKQAATLGSLWNGGYLLAQAGLLDGYACTVHPDSRAGLEETYPRVKLQPHPFVIDRERISCAGANSALSMMLALLRHHHGDEIVRGVEAILTCDRPVEDQVVYRMQAPGDDLTLPPALRTALQLMQSNIEEPLEIDELAQLAGISRRQIDRLFKRHMSATPSRYYLETRLTRARRLLQQTSESITSIAIACGFSNASHFSRCYREFFSVSPSQVGGARRQ